MAGIIDGEGSIYITRVREPRNRNGFALHPQLTISNTNELLLSHVKQITGCGSVCKIGRGNPLQKDVFQYLANSNGIRKILPQFLPHLVGKREQAQLLLRFLSLVRPSANSKFQPEKEMQHIYSKLRILNQKGKSRNSRIEAE